MKKENKKLIEEINVLGLTDEFLNMSDKAIKGSLLFSLYVFSGLNLRARLLLSLEMIIGRKFFLFLTKRAK